MYGLISHGARELLRIQERPKRTKRLRLSRRYRQRIFWRDGGKCVYCDHPVKFENATMDHVTPLVQKGRFRDKSNTVLSCRSCNNKKGPLELENKEDLAPEILWMKFDKVTRETRERKGHYREWISKFDKVAAVSS